MPEEFPCRPSPGRTVSATIEGDVPALSVQLVDRGLAGGGVIGRARRFFALPRNERRATAEAVATLTLVFLVLKTLPFAAAMRVFRLRAGDDLAQLPVDAARAAAAMMLRRRDLPAEVRFGVAKRDGAVTGTESAGEFILVARYAV